MKHFRRQTHLKQSVVVNSKVTHRVKHKRFPCGTAYACGIACVVEIVRSCEVSVAEAVDAGWAERCRPRAPKAESTDTPEGMR